MSPTMIVPSVVNLDYSKDDALILGVGEETSETLRNTKGAQADIDGRKGN